ncbi:MAG: FHA domain-containing protein, partial [Myxococcus sp.]|nr:FHA domain-containing protein [Myxococcus sp.]
MDGPPRPQLPDEVNTDRVRPVARVVQQRVITLVVRDPQGEARRVELREAPVRIGTHPQSDVVLADKTASRAHAEVRATAQGVVVRDLGS